MMSNTRILACEFEYFQPGSLKEAVDLMTEYGNVGKVLAGGTDVLVNMKNGRIAPEVLVDIRQIAELKHMNGKDGLSIGAAVLVRSVELSTTVAQKYTALAEAAGLLGPLQNRLMATICGNVCTASPSADAPPALLAFDAEASIIGPSGERVVPLDQFFVRSKTTVLDPSEILTRIVLPEPAPGLGSAFMKVARVAADISTVNTAVALERENDCFRSCRIVLGSVAVTPIRSKPAEEALEGQPYSKDLIEHASTLASMEVQPSKRARLGRSTPEYRRGAIKSLVRDAIQKAWDRASEKERRQ
jgi:CO/xanthine dehydrogenase FAD-binding subunit